MTEMIVVSAAYLLIGGGWWCRLAARQRKLSIVSFGRPKLTLSAQECRLILNDHLRQQRWAFGLVCFSASISIILVGALVIHRLIIRGSISGTEVSGMVTAATSLTLSGGALHVYKAATKQLYEILVFLVDQEPKAKKAIAE